MKHFLKDTYSEELDVAWSKAFDIIATPILDPYINDSNPGGLTDDNIKNI